MPLAEAATLTQRQRHAISNPSPNNQGNRSKQRPTRPEHAPACAHFEQHEPEQDLAALAELAVWCEQFSPIVGLEQTTQPDSLLLDVTGLAAIFGGEPRLENLIRKAFAARNFEVRIGLGDTVGAAWAMAHFGAGTTREQTLLELPIEALRLDPAMLDLLHQLGVVTVSQLMQLPRKALATRLGEEPLRRLDQLLGNQPEVIVAYRAAPVFEVERLLEHPTSRRDVVETILEQLAEQLSKQLAKHDHAVVQAEAVLHCSQQARQLTLSLFEPTSNAKHLYELLKLQSERVQLHQPIHRMQLRATATVRLHGGQQLLWDDVDAYTGRAQQRAVGALVDRLSSRLGKESVFGICAQAGALPEKSYRPKTLTNTLRQRKSQTPPTLKAPHRPLWLHDPPLRLQITPPKNGDLRYQPPSRFHWEQQWHGIVRHWGPERIETGWWRGRTVRRDYYRVETTAGSRFWLFRQLEDGAWFLHGCFE